MGRNIYKSDYFQSEDFKLHLGLLSKKFGFERIEKRTQEFENWITDFIDKLKIENQYEGVRLMNGLNIHEMSIYLNYFYWNQAAIVKQLVESSKKNHNVLISRYKIAAIKVYIISKYQPFEMRKENPLFQ